MYIKPLSQEGKIKKFLTFKKESLLPLDQKSLTSHTDVVWNHSPFSQPVSQTATLLPPQLRFGLFTSVVFPWVPIIEILYFFPYMLHVMPISSPLHLIILTTFISNYEDAFYKSVVFANPMSLPNLWSKYLPNFAVT
jgi:hypothetical protein